MLSDNREASDLLPTGMHKKSKEMGELQPGMQGNSNEMGELQTGMHGKPKEMGELQLGLQGKSNEMGELRKDQKGTGHPRNYRKEELTENVIPRHLQRANWFLEDMKVCTNPLLGF